MNKKIILPGLLVLYALAMFNFTFAQNVLEGSKGASSIDYTQWGGAMLSLNTADKKIELGYLNYKFKTRQVQNGQLVHYSNSPYWYGLTVSGKALNDYSTIFSKGKISPASDIKVRFGIRLYGDPFKFHDGSATIMNQITTLALESSNPLTTSERKDEIEAEISTLTKSLAPPKEIWLVTRIGYNVAKFNILQLSRQFDEQFIPTRFDGINGTIGINYWNPQLFNHNLIFLAGLTVGYMRYNNLDDLPEITAEDQATLTNQNGTTRTFKEKNVGFYGDYRTFDMIPVNFDLYFKPHKLYNAAFSFYGRINSYEIEGERQFPTNLGIGFYLLNENWLANPVGGVAFELRDAFKTLSTASFKESFVINFVARVNIFSYRK